MNFPVKEKYYVANAVKTKWKKRFMAWKGADLKPVMKEHLEDKRLFPLPV